MRLLDLRDKTFLTRSQGDRNQKRAKRPFPCVTLICRYRTAASRKTMSLDPFISTRKIKCRRNSLKGSLPRNPKQAPHRRHYNTVKLPERQQQSCPFSIFFQSLVATITETSKPIQISPTDTPESIPPALAQPGFLPIILALITADPSS